jgi:hypothetical protein
MTKPDRIALQNAEFDAVRELAEQYRRVTMTAVVDDDYPSVRADYERAVRMVIDTFRENGRKSSNRPNDIACPYCQASAGKPCFPSGSGYIHAARRKKAQEL